MRDIDAAILTQLQSGRLVARYLVFIIGKDFTTGAPEEAGFWTGLSTVTATVIDAKTQAPTARDFVGSGSIESIGDIVLSADIAVQTVTVRLSMVHDTVNNFIRGYDVRFAEIQIYIGVFNPETRELAANPFSLFLGYVDGAPITVDPMGGGSHVELQCVSNTREMTRSNPDKRSDESQQRRSAGDRFYQYTAVMGDRVIFWGQAQGSLNQAPKNKSSRPNPGFSVWD